MFADAGCIVLTAFISPYRADRDRARELHAKDGHAFIEVFVDAPLAVVEQRDPKGLYKKARAGLIRGRKKSFFFSLINPLTPLSISDFTGVSAPYEAPESPEIHIKTDECDVAESVRIIVDYLTTNHFLAMQA